MAEFPAQAVQEKASCGNEQEGCNPAVGLAGEIDRADPLKCSGLWLHCDCADISRGDQNKASKERKEWMSLKLPSRHGRRASQCYLPPPVIQGASLQNHVHQSITGTSSADGVHQHEPSSKPLGERAGCLWRCQESRSCNNTYKARSGTYVILGASS